MLALFVLANGRHVVRDDQYTSAGRVTGIFALNAGLIFLSSATRRAETDESGDADAFEPDFGERSFAAHLNIWKNDHLGGFPGEATVLAVVASQVPRPRLPISAAAIEVNLEEAVRVGAIGSPAALLERIIALRQGSGRPTEHRRGQRSDGRPTFC